MGVASERGSGNWGKLDYMLGTYLYSGSRQVAGWYQDPQPTQGLSELPPSEKEGLAVENYV